MRSAYREHLDAFAHDLIVLTDAVQDSFVHASTALLDVDVEDAEEALSTVEYIHDIAQRCEEQAVALLALESPVARDLRQVVSSIYIVEDLRRMGTLSQHIASIARRRHPHSALPEPLRGYFAEQTRLCVDLCSKVRELLVDPNADVALGLTTDDDAVDDIQKHVLSLLTQRPWPFSTVEAVDVTLLNRYFERFGDHCVNVATRIVYLTTGMNPEDYLVQRTARSAAQEVDAQIAEIERRFRSS